MSDMLVFASSSFPSSRLLITFSRTVASKGARSFLVMTWSILKTFSLESIFETHSSTDYSVSSRGYKRDLSQPAQHHSDQSSSTCAPNEVEI